MRNKQPRLYQEIGKQIKKDLLTQYNVGDRLPSEREIAEKYNVGRAVIREAIIMLELEDLVEARKGSGIYLINNPQSLDSILTEQIGPFEHLQARQIIESDIAKFAAMQATKSDIIQLQKALALEEQNLKDNDIDDSGDKMFHTYLAQATQNSAFIDIINYFWGWRSTSLMWAKLHSHINDTNYRRKWLADHKDILSAVQKKDTHGAYEAMWNHLEKVKETLIELSDTEDPAFDGFLYKDTPKFS